MCARVRTDGIVNQIVVQARVVQIFLSEEILAGNGGGGMMPDSHLWRQTIDTSYTVPKKEIPEMHGLPLLSIREYNRLYI